jgi:hypothetical protein
MPEGTRLALKPPETPAKAAAMSASRDQCTHLEHVRVAWWCRRTVSCQRLVTERSRPRTPRRAGSSSGTVGVTRVPVVLVAAHCRVPGDKDRRH